MEILVTCISSSWGGMEIMALENVKQLNKQGLKTELFCIKNSPLHLNAVKENIPTITTNSSIYKNITVLKKIVKNVKIIHSHYSHDLWAIVPALKLSRSNAKLFLTKHLASGLKKKDFFHRNLYKRVERIFCISEFIRKNVIQTCPVPETRASILHNGVDLVKFDKSKYSSEKIREELNIENDKIVIALIGRITPGKGHKEFIEAAGLINKSNGQKVIFLVIGSSAKGEEGFEKDIRQSAKDRGIKNIIFTGHRHDIPRILAGINILAFPSHEESFGITLLEAMAMEVPVAASRNAGITDIIPNEEYGMLINPKDSNSLARGLEKLVNDSGLRKKLASNARIRVEELFDIEKLIKELINYYVIDSRFPR